MSQYEDVHIQEIPKVVEIRDALSNLWYRVALEVDDRQYALTYTKYRIRVFAVRTGNVPEDRPAEGERFDPRFGDYGFCRALFDEYVRNYTSLVKAATRGLQDMDVFAEKVGYKKERPRCCATCQFAKRV